MLDIAIEQRNWLAIEADGTQVFEGQVEPGDLLHYEAEERIDLRTGNGAGLIVNYNGQDIGALGERGEVVERTFTVTAVVEPPRQLPPDCPLYTWCPRRRHRVADKCAAPQLDAGSQQELNIGRTLEPLMRG